MTTKEFIKQRIEKLNKENFYHDSFYLQSETSQIRQLQKYDLAIALNNREEGERVCDVYRKIGEIYNVEEISVKSWIDRMKKDKSIREFFEKIPYFSEPSTTEIITFE